MDELPSLSFTTWGRSGFGGRGKGHVQPHYSSLSSYDLMEEMGEEGEGEGGEEGEGGWESGEEEELLEKSRWASRRKWEQRIRSHSSLVSWFFDGGWQLLLKRY